MMGCERFITRQVRRFEQHEKYLQQVLSSCHAANERHQPHSAFTPLRTFYPSKGQ